MRAGRTIRDMVVNAIAAGRVRQANFGRHQTLGAVAEAHEHPLARLELGDAVAAQGFHVDEDVRRAVARASGSRSRAGG